MNMYQPRFVSFHDAPDALETILPSCSWRRYGRPPLLRGPSCKFQNLWYTLCMTELLQHVIDRLQNIPAGDQDRGTSIYSDFECRGKRGVGYCKSMPGAVRPFERMLARPKPAAEEANESEGEKPGAGEAETDRPALPE
jgi:hypothetical protein